jgi:hypothetical protein
MVFFLSEVVVVHNFHHALFFISTWPWSLHVSHPSPSPSNTYEPAVERRSRVDEVHEPSELALEGRSTVGYTLPGDGDPSHTSRTSGFIGHLANSPKKCRPYE